MFEHFSMQQGQVAQTSRYREIILFTKGLRRLDASGTRRIFKIAHGEPLTEMRKRERERERERKMFVTKNESASGNSAEKAKRLDVLANEVKESEDLCW